MGSDGSIDVRPLLPGTIPISLLGGGWPDRGLVCVSCLLATFLYCVHVFTRGLGGRGGKTRAKEGEVEKGGDERRELENG